MFSQLNLTLSPGQPSSTFVKVNLVQNHPVKTFSPVQHDLNFSPGRLDSNFSSDRLDSTFTSNQFGSTYDMSN